MEEYITPQMHIDYYTTQRGISVEDIGVAPIVIIAWGREIVQSFAGIVGASSMPYWLHNGYYQFFTGDVQGRQVSFAQVPMGAPGTVMLMEEMIACHFSHRG